jgi:opacity protein-like surface antigen
MSVRCICRLMVGLAAGLMATHNSLAQPYVGLGVSRLSLSSQHSSVDGRSGTGFTLFGGFEFASTWSAELSVSGATGIDTGPTPGIFYPADSAEYSILRLNVRKGFWTFTERRWTPWVTAGVAYHYINWDTFYYQLDGAGLSLGAGVDLELVRTWRVRIQAIRHSFSARDTYADGTFSSRSTELSAGVIYTFR